MIANVKNNSGGSSSSSGIICCDERRQSVIVTTAGYIRHLAIRSPVVGFVATTTTAACYCFLMLTITAAATSSLSSSSSTTLSLSSTTKVSPLNPILQQKSSLPSTPSSSSCAATETTTTTLPTSQCDHGNDNNIGHPENPNHYRRNLPRAALVSPGLRNLGNICYLNSQLECAFHIPRVRQLILAEESTTATTKTKTLPTDDADSDPTTAPPLDSTATTVSSDATTSPGLISLRRVFAEMIDASSSYDIQSDKRDDDTDSTQSRTTTTVASTTPSTTSTNNNNAVSPWPLCQALGIPLWEQQDTQEFWKLLLPALQCPSLMDLYQGSYEDYIRSLEEIDHDTTTTTTTTTKRRRYERSREETFLDLSLDLIQRNDNDESSSSNIFDSLQQMFQTPEVLRAADGNGWKPERGATTSIDAEKGARLHEQGLPSILQLHLKRFQYSWQSQSMTKINTPCIFPLVLDLHPFLTTTSTTAQDNQSKMAMDNNIHGNTDKDEMTTQPPPTTMTTTAPTSSSSCMYDLQSVVIHVGEFGSGHYYSYVRPDVTTNDWFRFNDHQVTRVTIQQVLQDAYGGDLATRKRMASCMLQPNSCHDNNNNSNKVDDDDDDDKQIDDQEVEYVATGANNNLWSWWQGRLKSWWWLTMDRTETTTSRTTETLEECFGGPTANAYVLQYVRRRDIPQLYATTMYNNPIEPP